LRGCAALAAGAAGAAIVLAQATDVNLTNVARGPSSAIDRPMEVVVRSAAAWEQLWTSHGATAPIPPIDFQHDMAAAVFLGTRNTGGFSVEILRARREGAAIVVEYVERRPRGDAIVPQVITAPFHIVRLASHTGPVEFRRLASADLAR